MMEGQVHRPRGAVATGNEIMRRGGERKVEQRKGRDADATLRNTADSRRVQVEEGWRALYKGLGPSLGGIIPAR